MPSPGHQVFGLGAECHSLSEPVISPDGSVFAFAKIEGRAPRKQRYLYVAPVTGGPLTRVAELAAPIVVARGGHDRLRNLAWSHDGAKLAYWGHFAEDWRVQDDDPALRLIDVRTRETTIVGRFRARTLGEGYLGPVLTDQAWAPDNRRLVYMKSTGELAILDVAARTETAIGLGAAATWSPDGQSIAARVRREADGADADYVVIAADPPHVRTVVLSYRAPGTLVTRAVWFTGAALWSPDGRFLIVRRVVGEHEELHALDRASGAVRKLPASFSETRSLGGRP